MKKTISTFSPRAISLTVLSKLLYALAQKSGASEELITLHKSMLTDAIIDGGTQVRSRANDSFSFSDIPWYALLDQIANNITELQEICSTIAFSPHEIRYMAAMACGLTGKEYGLITGFKSHYNVSLSIRHKFGLPKRSTNLRIFLQKAIKNDPN